MEESQSDAARASWELINKVAPAPEALERLLYIYNEKEQEELIDRKPWKKDPTYFKSVWVSALALIKMVIHARSGGQLEIMGLMQGKVMGDSLVIIDVFALPVEGTETRVNAGNDANEYMVMYQEISEKVDRRENIVGWYHSHPGYGCWLSGIDVETETLYQQHQDPFIAIVIDPIRTAAAGKVDIGAFRCYPEGYTPPNSSPSGDQTIPINKIRDFGLHWKKYYSVPINIFKSQLDSELLDLFWKSHWTSSLIASSIVVNKDYHINLMRDLSEKINQICIKYNQVSRPGLESGQTTDIYTEMKKLGTQSSEVASEKIQSLTTLLLTKALFRPPSELPALKRQLKCTLGEHLMIANKEAATTGD